MGLLGRLEWPAATAEAGRSHTKFDAYRCNEHVSRTSQQTYFRSMPLRSGVISGLVLPLLYPDGVSNCRRDIHRSFNPIWQKWLQKHIVIIIYVITNRECGRGNAFAFVCPCVCVSLSMCLSCNDSMMLRKVIIWFLCTWPY